MMKMSQMKIKNQNQVEELDLCTIGIQNLIKENGGGQTSNLCKLFIGGLGQSTQSSALRNHFSKYGKVLNAMIISEKKNQKISRFWLSQLRK